MPTIRKRGTRFQAQVRIKQGGAIVYEETATFDTDKQARMWGWGIEEQFKSGKIEPKPATTTLADVVKNHRSALIAADKDVRGIANSLKSIESSDMATKPILKITSADVVKWGKGFAETRSPATVLHALMTLRTCYSTARSEMGIKADVLEVADSIKHLTRLGLCGKSIERDRRVSDEEIDKLARWHEKLRDTTLPMRIAMNLAVALPRRSGELFGSMLWEHYDGEVIKLFDTKNPTRPRNEVVPVPPKARAIIEKLPKPKAGGPILPYNSRSISAAIYKACKMTQIEDLHLHDFRHEGVSRLFESGLDIPRVAMISGHLSWSTLKRYTHLSAQDVVAAMSKASTQPPAASPAQEVPVHHLSSNA